MSTTTRRALFAAAVIDRYWRDDWEPDPELTTWLREGVYQLPPDLESFDVGGDEQREVLKDMARMVADLTMRAIDAEQVAESYKARVLELEQLFKDALPPAPEQTKGKS